MGLLLLADILTGLIGIVLIGVFVRAFYKFQKPLHPGIYLTLPLAAALLLLGVLQIPSSTLVTIKHGPRASLALQESEQTSNEMSDKLQVQTEPQTQDHENDRMLMIASYQELKRFCGQEADQEEDAEAQEKIPEDADLDALLAYCLYPPEVHTGSMIRGWLRTCREVHQLKPSKTSPPTEPPEPLPCTRFTILHAGDGPEPKGCYAVGCSEGHAVPMQHQNGVWSACASYTRLEEHNGCYKVTDQNGSTRWMAMESGAWKPKRCK